MIALPLFAHENDLCSLLYFLLLSSEQIMSILAL